ncbi:hypothetical protein LCGC14_1535350 [marine sediment metagenome]|uniref:Uncharacterized protein n=1 Tax=marine sediment metagenome TaxID=412755 RepID=A0A0F9IUS6_9ZZZZ
MSWTTKSELEFIDGLGTYRATSNLRKTPKYRQRLLESYIKSIPFRANWGILDKEYITSYVKRRLAQENKQ